MVPSRTPIGSSERAVLEDLEGHLDSLPAAVSLTRKSAIEYLVEQGSDRSEAQAAIEELLSTGYLYEVDSELRISPRP